VLHLSNSWNGEREDLGAAPYTATVMLSFHRCFKISERPNYMLLLPTNAQILNNIILQVQWPLTLLFCVDGGQYFILSCGPRPKMAAIPGFRVRYNTSNMVPIYCHGTHIFSSTSTLRKALGRPQCYAWAVPKEEREHSRVTSHIVVGDANLKRSQKNWERRT
jgi:hypothetical protein